MATQFENESTAVVSTLEKCREIAGCPAGVDLQDHLRQLAAENAGLKDCVVKHAPAVEHWNAWADAEDKIQSASETPATDRIVAGIKADALPANIAEIIDSGDLETICYESERSYAEDFRLALYNFRQLREGADK
ncbi:hypothetical protein ACNAUL_06525 [Raoultella ornithinolytica]|uniref:hypothetical protein n=1 Tax=Raoultella ornithinolytica TaxID=54291 RepID=UPI00228B0126|nr:hypothetical protein [Raoultella ornithinolytica]HDV9415351.1 hypothetical protein [Raoultella ornithinolytica]